MPYRGARRLTGTDREIPPRSRALRVPAESVRAPQKERAEKPGRASVPLVLGHLEVAETVGVARKPAIQRFGNLLPVVRLLEKEFFARVAQKADFGENRGHLRSDQDHERR